ncbi:MAG: hypothetical protein GYA48_05795 [Chloroflexi bacterium]|nr:hypothetical protein [Chloroflexota bacterium]
MNWMRESLKKFHLAWAGLYFSVLTVIMTWPLPTRMLDAMVGQVGDNIYFVWMIGWLEKALFQLQVNPFDVWFLNYPEGWSLAYTEITPANLLIALPFSLLGGPMFGYNMALLLSFVLSGLGMYLWVRRMTDSTPAALLAGTAFAFIPYRFAHFLIGHLNLSGTQWFPFFFMGLFELIEARRWNWKAALVAGVSLGLIGLTSVYYLYMCLIVVGVMLLVYLLWIERARWKDGLFWKHLLLMGAVSLPLVIVAVAPFFALSQQGGLPDRNISIVRPYSASPTDFVLPSTDHFLWGAWVGDNFNRDLWIEGTLYVGAVSGALALLAWLKRKDSQHAKVMQIMLAGGLLAVILAMGIDLHWNGESVLVRLPEFVAGRLGRVEAPIPLPGFVLFYVFPFFAKLRALMRFGIFALVFVCALAGLGGDWLLKRVPTQWKQAAAAALIVLVLFDFYPGPYTEFAQVPPRVVDTWLAAQPDDAPLVQMPFRLAEDQEQTYYTLFHEKPYVGGFFNAFPPRQYREVIPVLEGFPDEASVALLKEFGVKYVLVQASEYADMQPVQRDCEALGLELVNKLDGQWVFILPEGSSHAD